MFFSDFHSRSVLCGAFVWARRALNCPFRRFTAPAVGVFSFVGTASALTWMKWDARRTLDASGCTAVCAAGGSADVDAGAQYVARGTHTHQATLQSQCLRAYWILQLY